MAPAHLSDHDEGSDDCSKAASIFLLGSSWWKSTYGSGVKGGNKRVLLTVESSLPTRASGPDQAHARSAVTGP